MRDGLDVYVPAQELFDERTEIFYTIKEPITITMVHSLLSISKWEAKWHVPFVDNDKITDEQMIDYLRCMTITKNVPDAAYYVISTSAQDMKQISDYLANPMTARKPSRGHGRSRKIVTADLIYFWMFSYNIPIECEKWHLNRLLALIQTCSDESEQPKKMNKRDLYNQNRELNALRRKKYHTKG